MPVLRCPHCEIPANFTRRYQSPATEILDVVQGTLSCHAAWSCDNCNKIIRGVEDATGQTAVRWWPVHIGGKGFPDAPEHIGAAANEAHLCLSVNAFRAAVGMARAVVEGIAKERASQTAT